MFDVVIRNGTLVTPNGVFNADLGIEDGKIKSISKSGLSGADRVINAEGKYVFPGLVDPHLHITRDFEQTCYQETESFAFGGITSCFNFVSSKDHLKELLESSINVISKKSVINMGLHAIISNLAQTKELYIYSNKYGVTSFKFLMAAQEKELYPGTFAASDGTIFSAFEEIAKLGYPATALVHAENWEISFALRDRFISENRASTQEDYIDSRPRICEIEAMSRMIQFAKHFDCRLYFPHVSTAEGMDLIGKSQADGWKITGETCTHYLTFTKDHKFPLPAKVNPPLREKNDVEALWNGLINGQITCVASDYVPGNMGKLDSNNVFESAGMPGRTPGMILPLLLTEVNKGRFTPELVAQVTSTNAAKWFGIFPQKGSLSIGADADLTVVDMKMTTIMSPETLHATSDATWYDGLETKGWPVLTMVGGVIVTERDEFHGPKGTGKYLGRSLQSSAPETTRTRAVP
ncbi:MAG: amidohydrolase family protein [Thaumarchaeota archaeon]|nr:amidohydrolase family protein [Nitrososphaerota archaeon]